MEVVEVRLVRNSQCWGMAYDIVGNSESVRCGRFEIGTGTYLPDERSTVPIHDHLVRLDVDVLLGNMVDLPPLTCYELFFLPDHLEFIRSGDLVRCVQWDVLFDVGRTDVFQELGFGLMSAGVEFVPDEPVGELGAEGWHDWGILLG
jgi:hypothetical protein